MMAQHSSLWSFIVNAGPVVKGVMLVLFGASLVSWTIIFRKLLLFRGVRSSTKKFTRQFNAADDWSKLYVKLKMTLPQLQGMEKIFCDGFGEYCQLKKWSGAESALSSEGVERVMKVAVAKQAIWLEQGIPYLATIGSISPYVGLFGTVWGIMTSFQALSSIRQATIAMVAPGISEALIATAMGLFAAIPAVVAYNYCVTEIDQLTKTYQLFSEEFLGLLFRRGHGGVNKKAVSSEAIM